MAFESHRQWDNGGNNDQAAIDGIGQNGSTGIFGGKNEQGVLPIQPMLREGATPIQDGGIHQGPPKESGGPSLALQEHQGQTGTQETTQERMLQ